VAGAAAATNIAQAASMAAAWIYMHKKYPFFRYRLRELRGDTAVIKETCRVGSPIALQLMIVAVGISLIQRAVNSFGQVMTATFAVGQRIEMYLHLPCNALMTTLATFTGQNVGANRMDRVKQGVRQGVLISFGVTLILALFIRIFAGELPALFALGETATAYSVEYLNATAFIVVILSLYVPVFGVFQGTRHVLIPAFVALAALTLRVIVTYSLKDSDFLGHTVIWWNGLFGFSLGCTVTWVYYFSNRWQRDPLGRK
jgi:Na+-driven multidrug efflux pump